MPERTAAEVRAAIERELRERLEAGSARAASDGARGETLLQCVACGHLNGLDARFCTQCGAPFNAIVVGPPASKGGER